MIVKCKDNDGVGDCPYKPFCLPRLNDRTITGCSMPFVWAGLIDASNATVEHTVKGERKEE